MRCGRVQRQFPKAPAGRRNVRRKGLDFTADDVLLFGRESAGVSETVHTAADARLLIPMRPGMRSLNVAIAAALAAGEALRQTSDNGSAQHTASNPLRG